MALKDDATGLARSLTNLADNANEIVLAAGVGSLTDSIIELAHSAQAIADLIPTPEQARRDTGLATDDDEADDDNIDGGGWSPAVNDDAPFGQAIGRVDRRGDLLRVGDRVQVYGSDRYGNPQAVVRGPGPYLGDGKPRVHVALRNGVNNEYTPSTGRVEKLNGASSGNGAESDAVSVLEIQITPGGLRVREIHEPSTAFTTQ